MSQEERYSGKRGLQGCLVGWVIMAVVPLGLSLVFNEWLGLMSNEVERIIIVFIWFLAVSLGGYVAARLGRTTGWTNALIVGLLAEFFLFAQIRKAARLDEATDHGFLAPILDMMKDLGTHWRALVELALTIPIAIIGGLIWQTTGGARSPGQVPSEPVKESSE
jgi:hypothetical protein